MNKLIIQMVFLAICSFATSLSAQNSSGQGQAKLDENQLLVDPEKAFGLQLRFME